MNSMLSKDKEKGTNCGAVLSPTHIMSVDLEDYFMVEAFASSVSQDSWESRPSRVVMSTRRILDLFDKYNVKGTFFFVGWVAKQFPELVRECTSRTNSGNCFATHPTKKNVPLTLYLSNRSRMRRVLITTRDGRLSQLSCETEEANASTMK